MAKARTLYVCSSCGHATSGWLGRCPACNAWNTLSEQLVDARSARPVTRASPKVVSLGQVPVGDGGEVRLRTGMGELDRVLGGGLVTGSLTLIGGDPGVGKSTLILMAVHALARRGAKVLYVSGEESVRQIRLRAERLGVADPGILLLAETDLDAAVAAVAAEEPRVLVIDSVQTMYRPAVESAAGSVLQVREVAAAAMRVAKERDIATFLIGHVTKDGALAGPRALEHLVDTVLYVEGDGGSALRVLRSTKNRFGSTGEIGLFEMREEGLVEVPDASARLLKERARGAPGTVVTCGVEGSRPLLVEVQALVGRPTQGTPARTAVGLDRARLLMQLAVLGRFGVNLSDRDVFVSVVGGVRLQEPAADLAVAAALWSSARGAPLPDNLVAFGELGLVGELRGVGFGELRLREAQRHGFRRALVPAALAREGQDGGKLRLSGARHLGEAFEHPPVAAPPGPPARATSSSRRPRRAAPARRPRPRAGPAAGSRRAAESPAPRSRARGARRRSCPRPAPARGARAGLPRAARAGWPSGPAAPTRDGPAARGSA